MTENYSALSRFRISTSDDNQSLSLSIWNAENDTIQQLSYKNFDDFSLTRKLIEKINLEIKNNNITKGYKHWIDHGWYRSVDYYISSRAYYNKNTFPKLKYTDENIQHSLLKENNLLNREISRPFGFFKHCFIGERKGYLIKNLLTNLYFIKEFKIVNYQQ